MSNSSAQKPLQVGTEIIKGKTVLVGYYELSNGRIVMRRVK